MEEFKNERKEQEIVFSKAIKAGKRIYYLDVKKSRNNDLFLAITESKKRFNDDENAPVTFEKHKIFLYKEDFDKFSDAFLETIDFIKKANEANGITDYRDYRSQNQPRQVEESAVVVEEPVVADVKAEEKAENPVSKYDVEVDFEI
ncbi:MAG: DUF3276 family protein [bacterium]